MNKKKKACFRGRCNLGSIQKKENKIGAENGREAVKLCFNLFHLPCVKIDIDLFFLLSKFLL